MGKLLCVFLSKSATSARLYVSEVLLLLFGIVLVVGLIGEYKKPERWTEWLRVFELMVIIGVAGELIADGGIFLFSQHLQTISDTEVARLNKEAGEAWRSAGQAKAQSDSYQRRIAESDARAKSAEAQVASANAASRDAVAKVASAEARIAEANRAASEANARAAEAKQAAEAERLERVKLEQRVADRHVTVEQRKKMLEILRSRKGATVVIDPVISEGRDTFPYAREIAEVFRDAKDAQWDAENPWRLITMDTPLHGFLIEVQHDSAVNAELANVTEKALSVLDPRVTQKRVPSDPNSARDIIVLVGGK